jgi:ABC-type multidrug transport system fused ATPase/permease subunit
VQGVIEFNNVNFNYPARPDVHVLRDMKFKVNTGETMALVGPSGCGKSTVVQLLQRFYDPNSGQVCQNGYIFKCDFAIPQPNLKIKICQNWYTSNSSVM